MNHYSILKDLGCAAEEIILMGAHNKISEDPNDPLIRKASTTGHRMVLGPGEPALSEWAEAKLSLPDEKAMMEYRVKRIRSELEKADLAGILLFDPMNQMYATYSPNMQLWITHNPSRYVFLATDGPLIQFDYPNCEFLSAHNHLVDEVRPATTFFYFVAGDRVEEQAQKFASEIADLIKTHGGGNRRLAVDVTTIAGNQALQQAGLDLVEGTQIMESARMIKSHDEITAMRCSVETTRVACQKTFEAMKPGITENQLWAVMWSEMLSRHGEWMECRLLSAGERTNPWFQESSSNIINEGDLVAFDTDFVGPYSMMTDISRTWICGGAKPNKQQNEVHSLAVEQMHKNMELLTPGTTFYELTHNSWTPPVEDYRHYSCLFHGVGQCDEYPDIVFPEAWEESGYDGVLMPGMVLTVEAYVGSRSGGQGVKLEDQVLITENGYENLSAWTLDLEKFERL